MAPSNQAECCCSGGPGYKTPQAAFEDGPVEQILYVTCVKKLTQPNSPDYLATVDVNPNSNTYCKVINRTFVPNAEDELHHSGWNACSSCYDDEGEMRRYLICPSLTTHRVNVIDIATDPLAPIVHKVIPAEVFEERNLGYPHTVHCLKSKEVMISTIGDPEGNAKGGFLLFDNKSFEVIKEWSPEHTPFGYDFWYQPRLNVMISTGWGAMKHITKGLNPMQLSDPKIYSSEIYVWNWTKRTIVQTLNLGNAGLLPLEVRFFHEPTKSGAFVGCAIGGSVFYIYQNKEDGTWKAENVITIPQVHVDGWLLPTLPPVITDILVSMDDRFLYVSNWLLGELHQYEITDPFHPKLTGVCRIGGILANNKAVSPAEMSNIQPFTKTVVKGVPVEGGPQMLQLSLDGRRLYVTTSLYSVWDNQFYPKLGVKGGVMLKVDVLDPLAGGLKIDEEFCVDFGEEPDGPSVGHEMRYPGGDCSSDIWC